MGPTDGPRFWPSAQQAAAAAAADDDDHNETIRAPTATEQGLYARNSQTSNYQQSAAAAYLGAAAAAGRHLHQHHEHEHQSQLRQASTGNTLVPIPSHQQQLQQRQQQQQHQHQNSHQMYKGKRRKWRVLLAIGLLLPALAAIIGIVAWAISIEVATELRQQPLTSTQQQPQQQQLRPTAARRTLQQSSHSQAPQQLMRGASAQTSSPVAQPLHLRQGELIALAIAQRNEKRARASANDIVEIGAPPIAAHSSSSTTSTTSSTTTTTTSTTTTTTSTTRPPTTSTSRAVSMHKSSADDNDDADHADEASAEDGLRVLAARRNIRSGGHKEHSHKTPVAPSTEQVEAERDATTTALVGADDAESGGQKGERQEGEEEGEERVEEGADRDDEEDEDDCDFVGVSSHSNEKKKRTRTKAKRTKTKPVRGHKSLPADSTKQRQNNNKAVRMALVGQTTSELDVGVAQHTTSPFVSANEHDEQTGELHTNGAASIRLRQQQQQASSLSAETPTTTNAAKSATAKLTKPLVSSAAAAATSSAPGALATTKGTTKTKKSKQPLASSSTKKLAAAIVEVDASVGETDTDGSQDTVASADRYSKQRKASREPSNRSKYYTIDEDGSDAGAAIAAAAAAAAAENRKSSEQSSTTTTTTTTTSEPNVEYAGDGFEAIASAISDTLLANEHSSSGEQPQGGATGESAAELQSASLASSNKRRRTTGEHVAEVIDHIVGRRRHLSAVESAASELGGADASEAAADAASADSGDASAPGGADDKPISGPHIVVVAPVGVADADASMRARSLVREDLPAQSTTTPATATATASTLAAALTSTSTSPSTTSASASSSSTATPAAAQVRLATKQTASGKKQLAMASGGGGSPATKKLIPSEKKQVAPLSRAKSHKPIGARLLGTGTSAASSGNKFSERVEVIEDDDTSGLLGAPSMRQVSRLEAAGAKVGHGSAEEAADDDGASGAGVALEQEDSFADEATAQTDALASGSSIHISSHASEPRHRSPRHELDTRFQFERYAPLESTSASATSNSGQGRQNLSPAVSQPKVERRTSSSSSSSHSSLNTGASQTKAKLYSAEQLIREHVLKSKSREQYSTLSPTLIGNSAHMLPTTTTTTSAPPSTTTAAPLLLSSTTSATLTLHKNRVATAEQPSSMRQISPMVLIAPSAANNRQQHQQQQMPGLAEAGNQLIQQQAQWTPSPLLDSPMEGTQVMRASHRSPVATIQPDNYQAMESQINEQVAQQAAAPSESVAPHELSSNLNNELHRPNKQDPATVRRVQQSHSQTQPQQQPQQQQQQQQQQPLNPMPVFADQEYNVPAYMAESVIQNIQRSPSAIGMLNGQPMMYQTGPGVNNMNNDNSNNINMNAQRGISSNMQPAQQQYHPVPPISMQQYYNKQQQMQTASSQRIPVQQQPHPIHTQAMWQALGGQGRVPSDLVARLTALASPQGQNLHSHLQQPVMADRDSGVGSEASGISQVKGSAEDSAQVTHRSRLMRPVAQRALRHLFRLGSSSSSEPSTQSASEQMSDANQPTPDENQQANGGQFSSEKLLSSASSPVASAAPAPASMLAAAAAAGVPSPPVSSPDQSIQAGRAMRSLPIGANAPPQAASPGQADQEAQESYGQMPTYQMGGGGGGGYGHQMGPQYDYQSNENQKSKGITFHFGGGPIGGGTQLITSPMGIFKHLMIPLLPNPRVNLNGKVVFGVVLEKNTAFGHPPKKKYKFWGR